MSPPSSKRGRPEVVQFRCRLHVSDFRLLQFFVFRHVHCLSFPFYVRSFRLARYVAYEYSWFPHSYPSYLSNTLCSVGITELAQCVYVKPSIGRVGGWGSFGVSGLSSRMGSLAEQCSEQLADVSFLDCKQLVNVGLFRLVSAVEIFTCSLC